MNAVGFDLDNTLAVPTRDRETLFQEALDAVDGPPISRAEYVRAHGAHLATETREPIFAAILDDYDDDTDPAALSVAYRERILEAIVPVPGAEDLVDRLRREYRVGLLTDGPYRAQYSKLEELGWTDLFDAVVITGTLPAGKPDPRAFDSLLAELDAESGQTAYVGDYPEADIAGAKDASLAAVQVVSGEGPHPHPRADAVIEREELSRELPAVLAGLES